jgi:hypothetical protein
MSDLSKVLGDLYGGDDADHRPSVAPARNFRDAAAPEWADDDRLDQAFENWTPGPPPEAPAAEHDISSYVIDAPAVPPAQLDDDLAATLGQALAYAGSDNADPEVPFASADDPAAASFGMVTPAPAPAPAPALPADIAAELPALPTPAGRWERSSDDILPSKAAGKGRSRPTFSLPKLRRK